MAEKKIILAPLNAARHRQLQKFAQSLGIEFEKIELLHVAMTHKSYTKQLEENNEKRGITNIKYANNERLEFLGDAVLEMASSIYLFNKFENLSEGDLTKTRASIVCGSTLTKLANKLGFGSVLLLGYGEISQGGRGRNSILENAFEAVIGAIYQDKGWEVAKDYVWRQMADEFKNVKVDRIADDAKSILQEYSQRAYSGELPEYIELSMDGPPHNRTFECAVKVRGEICGKGVGKSKQLAEKMAAEAALRKLNVIKD